MKTILHLKYSIRALILFTVAGLTAQNVTKQTINTNPDVTIAVNTSNADVIIETWNKNKVEVKSVVEQEKPGDQNPGGQANSFSISISSSPDKVTINGQHKFPYLNGGNNFIVFADRYNGNDDVNIIIPEIDVHSRINLDSLIPPMPNFEDMEEIKAFSYDFDFDFPEFDYEAFKQDEAYLQKWQAEMQSALKKMQVEIKSSTTEHQELRKEELKERLKKAAEKRKEMSERRAELQKERAEMHKKMAKERKKELEKVKAEREKIMKKRVEIKRILADKNKALPKATLYLKVPKDAVFEMNVKYGTVQFVN